MGSATARYDFNWNGEDDYIVTHMDNHASVYVRAYQASETQKSTISGGYEIAFLFWTGEVVVFGQDCDWATIRYNVGHPHLPARVQDRRRPQGRGHEDLHRWPPHHLVQHVRGELPCGLHWFQDFLQRPGGAQPHGRELVDADPFGSWPRRVVMRANALFGWGE